MRVWVTINLNLCFYIITMGSDWFISKKWYM